MINWLKNLFTPKYSSDNLPKFQGAYPPMPKCNPSKQNISEPVYAIERSMIEHPSRWKVSRKLSDILLSNPTSHHYTILDIKNKLKFYGNSTSKYSYSDPWVIELEQFVCIDWATVDEKNYLWQAVQNMQDKKLERVERIRQVKKNKERQRLMEIYK